MRYQVLKGRVTVKARSSIHDTTTVFTKPSGTIDLDPEDPIHADASIELDMATFDAGDRLKNWKLRGDIDADSYPTAVFRLERIERFREVAAGRFEATAYGSINWRDGSAKVVATGEASIDRRAINASATFDLNVRDLNMEPPSFLVFKVEEVVSVQVTFTANAVS